MSLVNVGGGHSPLLPAVFDVPLLCGAATWAGTIPLDVSPYPCILPPSSLLPMVRAESLKGS